MNKKNLRQNAEKGITLIALIITIIVMLILVAVTISMAVNGGLFEYAGKAVGETQNVLDVEQELSNGKIQVDGKWYASIEAYLAGKPEVTAIHSWEREGDTFTCSHCEAEYIMGEGVYYPRENKGETITTILTAEKSGLDKFYAKYSEYPEIANVDANGNQIIEAQDTFWVVLGIEDANGDGVNETLLITTLDPVESTQSDKRVYFYGAAAYNNGPDEINRICKELYSNSEYGEARGMTIEDVNAAFNYTPHGGEYYDSADNTWKTTGNLTTKLKDLPIFNSLKGNGTYTPDGTNTEAALGEYELNGYAYFLNEDGLSLSNMVNEETATITEKEACTIFRGEVYWLASCGIGCDPETAFFGLGSVGQNSAGVGSEQFVSYDYTYERGSER